MNKFKIMTGILLVFLLGGIAGSLGTSIYMRQRFQTMMEGPPDFLIPKFIRKLEKELDLSMEQQAQIRKISAEFRKELDEFMEKNRPQADGILDRHINCIKSVLRPDQQIKMEEIRERMKQRWKRRQHESGRHRKMMNSESALPRLRDRLGLSEEQMRQIAPLIRKIIPEMQELCGKGRSEDCSALPENLLLSDPETEKQLEKILTPEQMRLLREDNLKSEK